jgi:hypothetical protein
MFTMKTSWQGRMTGAAAKYGEHAPMATTCCNACRTCVQTNMIALALATVVGAGAFAVRLVGRVRPSA